MFVSGSLVARPESRAPTRSQLVRQGQPAPPAPQLPAGKDGSVRLVAPSPPPTIPGAESSFARFRLWQDGQAATRSAVTNASNADPQSSHRYSKMGIGESYQKPFLLPWFVVRDSCLAGPHLNAEVLRAVLGRDTDYEPRTPNHDVDMSCRYMYVQHIWPMTILSRTFVKAARSSSCWRWSRTVRGMATRLAS